MTEPSLERRFVGGAWRYVVREEPSGSQPFTVIRVPFAFDTPGLVADAGPASTGIVLYTPTPGDALLDISYVSVTTPWDGNNPVLELTYGDLSEQYEGCSLGQTDQVDSVDQHTLVPNTQGLSGAPVSIFPDATPLRAIIDDGAGGDPGSNQGEGEVVIVLIPAAA